MYKFHKKTKGKKFIMKKLSFTLAEVLITLVIIGVIAAMTVPTLMNNTQGQEYKSALKKAISGMNQALTLNYALEGLMASDYSTSAQLAQSVFKVRMSTVDASDFTASAKSGSGADEVCSTAGGKNIITTADGMKFCITNFTVANTDSQGITSYCNTYNTVPCVTSSNYPNLWIDVNGDRKPNSVTTSSNRPKDIYQALIYAQKVVPYGYPTQQVMFDKEANT